MTIGVAEVCWSMQEVSSLTYHIFEALIAATVIYLVLSLTIAGSLNLINIKLKILPNGQEPLSRKIADILFYPLELLGSGMEYLLWYFRKAPDAKTVSPLRRMLKVATKSMILGAKATFVAVLLYILYEVGMAIASFNFEVIWNNLYTLLFWRFPNGDESEFFMGLGGLSGALLMSIISITGSFFIGLLVGMGRTAKNRAFRIPSMIYIEFVRGIPLILVIFWFYTVVLDIMLKIELHAFWAATIAMTFFFAAYIAETVRGGIENIPAGQVEAAKASGLSYFQTMRKIVLPQALKQMLPALVGMFIAAFKDTSLAYIIGVMELTRAAYAINNRLMVYPFEIYTTIAVMYFVFSYFMSLYAKHLERKLNPENVRIEM